VLRRVHDPFPFRQRKQLFRNLANGRFEEVTDRAGAVFQLSEVGRGAAFGDIDNDGDVDVLVGNDAGSTRLLINNVGTRQHWLGLRLVGATKRPSTRSGRPELVEGRDMYGARVAVFRPEPSRGTTGAPTLWRRARADGSYASANDSRVLVGLGDSTEAPRIRVVWPSGRVEEWSTVPIDRYTTLIEGSGR
jgi:enediyne biosynthesis protein E4